MAGPRSRSAERAVEQWLKTRRRAASGWLRWTVLAGLIEAPLILAQAGLLAYVINAVVVERRGLASLAESLGLLLIVFVARFVASVAKERLAFEGAARIRYRLRRALFAHVTALGPAWARGRSSGELSHLLGDALESMDRYFRDYLPQMMLAAALPLVLWGAVLVEDWVSALIMIITAPLVPMFMIVIGKGTAALNRRQWRRLARMSAYFFDAIEGLTTLKIFAASRAEIRAVAAISQAYRRDTLAILRLAFVSSLVLEFLVTLSIAMIAVYIGFRLYSGDMTFLPGLFVLILAPEFYRPLRDTGTQYHARMEAIGAAEGLIALFDAPLPTTVDSGRDTAVVVSAPLRRVVFEDVGFVYAGQEQAVLSGLNFALARGRHVAVVGPSGAGKTTLAYLLLGFLQPTQGRITVDGRARVETTDAAWLSRVAWVPQQPTLFHGTIRDNIRLGRPDADQVDVARAAEAAGAHVFITALDHGYDSVLGDRGQGMSGGQIQRIALARAFLADADIVVLDEPSASLDPESEAALTQAIDRLAVDRMLVTIAHRLDTVRRADDILLLADGGIRERGTHETLLAAGGRYARLWTLYRAEDVNATGQP